MSVNWATYRRLLGMARDDWPSKYLTSDHHVDRVAFAKIDYRDKTGLVYIEPPERGRPIMARGKGGSFDSGSLIISTRRRETSPDYEAFGASRKAYRISHTADSDASELSKKSRDRDRQLLSNITQRLVDSDCMDAVTADAVMYKPPPSPRRPPLSSNYMGPDDLPLSPLFVRASSLPPRRKKVKVFDVEYEPETKPRKQIIDIYESEYKPYKPRVYSRTHRPKVEVYSQIYKPMYEYTLPIRPKAIMYEDEYVPMPKPPTRIFTHRTPVRVGTQIPRYPNRAFSEPPIIRSYNRPTSRIVTPSAQLAVTNARRSLDRIERELGLEPSFEEPTVIHRQARPVIKASPAPIRNRTAGPVHASPRVRTRSASVPASPRVAPKNKSRIADIETRIEAEAYTKLTPTMPLSELRARTSEAKNKLDTHKVMMDRYLPIYLGPENDVEYEVDYKYGELVERMPQLDPYRPIMGSVGDISSSSVAPYKPVNRVKSNPGTFVPQRRGNFRPHVSDTRRRIRDVICSTRKDPHYFD